MSTLQVLLYLLISRTFSELTSKVIKRGNSLFEIKADDEYVCNTIKEFNMVIVIYNNGIEQRKYQAY